MRSFTLVATFLALALVVSATPVKQNNYPTVYGYKQGDRCPAKEFYDDCNHCHCDENGYSAGCTKMICVHSTRNRALNAKNIPVVYGYKKGDRCPAKEFYDDCNHCHCDENGYSAGCTKMICVHSTRNRALNAKNIPVVYGYKEGDRCPAKEFYDDCNYCRCGENGHAAGCTKMACTRVKTEKRAFQFPPVVHGYKQGTACPAKIFFDECNACVCNEDGQSAGCTLILCPSSREAIPNYPRIDDFDEVGKCPPFLVFYNKCNTCRCGPSGNYATCTQMACPDHVAKE